MMHQKIVHTLLAAAFATLAMTGVAQAIAPSQSDTSAAETDTSVAQTNADQDRLSASKGDSSGTQSATGTTTDTNAGQPNAAPAAKHPPTSIMDRATPTLSAPNKQSGRKHPPTSVMDSVTPQEKSPGTDESPSGSQTPSKTPSSAQ